MIKQAKLSARQGDVGIDKVDAVPTDAKPKNNRIIAYGEGTGHYHEVDGDVCVLERDGEMFVDSNESFTLTHHGSPGDEHEKIQFPPGTWRFTIQREYDPYAANRERRVVD